MHTIPTLFVDNRILLVSETSLSKLENLANRELKNISEWMLSNGLTLDPKTFLALNIFPYARKSIFQFILLHFKAITQQLQTLLNI